MDALRHLRKRAGNGLDFCKYWLEPWARAPGKHASRVKIQGKGASPRLAQD